MKIRTFILAWSVVNLILAFAPPIRGLDIFQSIGLVLISSLYWTTERRLDRATADPRLAIKFIHGPARSGTDHSPN